LKRNERNKMKTKSLITDEVRERTTDILEHYSKSNFEGIEKILDELTPKLKEGVIHYLNGFILYINGWSDNDSEKKCKLLNFKIVKELVQKYPLHPYQFSSELLKEMKDEVSEYRNEMK